MTTATIISAACSVLTALFVFYWQRRQTRRDRLVDARSDALRRESLLMLRSIDAIGALSNITAKRVMNQELNGDVKEAQAYYMDTKHELEDYLRENSVNANH